MNEILQKETAKALKGHKNCKTTDLIPLYYFYGNEGVAESQFGLSQINKRINNSDHSNPMSQFYYK